jgi:hypothetical protein
MLSCHPIELQLPAELPWPPGTAPSPAQRAARRRGRPGAGQRAARPRPGNVHAERMRPASLLQQVQDFTAACPDAARTSSPIPRTPARCGSCSAARGSRCAPAQGGAAAPPRVGREKQVVDRARNPPVFANQQATGYPYSSANALISRKIDSAGTRNAE